MDVCSSVAVSVILLTCMFAAYPSDAAAADSDPPRMTATPIGPPLRFVLNEGLWDARIKAGSIGSRTTMSFGREGYRIAMRQAPGPGEAASFSTPYPGLRLLDISSRCSVEGVEETAPQLRYLQGEGERFVTHMLTQYRTIRYAQAWDGIDLDVTGGGGALRHTVRVVAGADPSRVRLRFDHTTREQVRIAVQGNGDAGIRIIERDGGVDVSLTGAPSKAAFTVTLTYNYYWGGGGNEWGNEFRVDRAGDLHITGATLSLDFPLVPPGAQYPSGHTLVYAAVLSADGQGVRYSTALEESASYTAELYHFLAVGKHDRTILQLVGGNIARFLTPDAEFGPRYPSGSALVVLDSAGAIVYGTATPDSGRITFYDMESGNDGAIYAVSGVYGQPAFLTADAYQPTFQGDLDGLVMKFDADSYRMTYASLLGGPQTDYINAVTVDGCGSVAVAGTCVGGGYPVVNAVQPNPGGAGDLVFTRFTPDLQSIVFSTYLGGRGHEQSWWWNGGGTHWGGGRALRYDPGGRLYFVGDAVSGDFPLMRPLNIPHGSEDLVIGSFSPFGELLFSSYFGGSSDEYYGAMDVDACGNMIIRGISGSQDLPIVNPIADSGFTFLSVIDTRSATVRFSSRLPVQDYSYKWWNHARLVLDGTSVYLASTVRRTRSLPTTPGYPDGGGNDSADVQITRFDMPGLCSRKVFEDRSRENGGVHAVLLGTDTLRIDLDRMKQTPERIRVTSRVRNESLLLPSDSVILTLRVPAGLAPAAGAPPLRQVLPPLAPGDSVDVLWELAAVLDSIIPNSALAISVFYFTGGECPSIDSFAGVIPVLYTHIPEADLRCALSLSPAFAVNHDTTRLEHDTMLVTLRISNPGETTGWLKYALVRISGIPGVRLLPPPDSVVVPPPVPGKGSIELRWMIEVKSWPFGRPLPITAVLVDTFGIVIATCTLRDDIPGTFGSVCGLQVSDPVRVRADDSSFVPDPVIAIMRITNPTDTLRPYRDLRLDLSSARHIKPAAGETLKRPDFTIEEDSSRDFTWMLRMSPPPSQSVTETVRAIYRTNADTTERSCAFDVRIILLSSNVTCSLSCPDTLFLDGATARHLPDTVEVTAVLRNTGGLEQDIEGAMLSVEPGGAARLLDPALQVVASLKPGKSDTVIWKLRVPVLPEPRPLRFTVSVLGPGGRELSNCIRGMQAMALPVSCAASAPDSVRYDVVSGRFDPETFELTASLENRSDTAYTILRAMLDETLLQRALLAAGETAEQQRAELSPGERWQVRWRLEPQEGDRDYAQRLRVRFSFEPAIPPTLCEAVTLIGGAPREVDLRCETAGHDSVWADNYYETLIPDPVQVQYTLRNDGNATSTSCAVAIVPPPMLELAEGEDSVRTIPALAPGERYSAEWLLRLVPERITSEPWVIRWESDCEGAESCEHRVTFVDRSPAGVVVTPWLLRFTAEREGPLPATREVRLWTGGGLTPAWSITTQPAWLDAVPSSGAGHTVMIAGPNTTSLTVGPHAGVLQLDVLPLSTGDIRVLYDIGGKLGTGDTPSPEVPYIGVPYPNPVSAGADVRVLLRAEGDASLRLELRDLLGRLRHDAVVPVAGRDAAVRIQTGNLSAGTYVLTVRGASGLSTRMIVVLP